MWSEQQDSRAVRQSEAVEVKEGRVDLRAEMGNVGLAHRQRVAALPLGLHLLQVALQRAAVAVLEDGVRVVRAHVLLDQVGDPSARRVQAHGAQRPSRVSTAVYSVKHSGPEITVRRSLDAAP